MFWRVGNNFSLDLDKSPIIMGILNITPDSFSDAGSYMSPKASISHAKTMIQQGADIIDIGGESTRPGAEPISAQTEQTRILPIVKTLLQDFTAILSIDTYNHSTAAAALALGAHIINDVYGLQKAPQMAEIVANFKAGIVIMHTNRERVPHRDIIEDQKFFFDKSLTIAAKAGIQKEAIVLDPGFGFGKDYIHNMALFTRIGELAAFGYPLLAGISRKKSLGRLKHGNAAQSVDMDVATSVLSVLLRERGFSIFRVHNVAVNCQALAVADAWL
ncbi:dihydropteroate synthase [Bartonella sp. TP]|uniref:dihydropteroate synthase n=1 Tax=Bartonella sp. TP TaxID=3057550 RepID=UPI0025B24981|nr:dihydropteroate synthase [Bartonella sp. TP]WJW80037.1 dihydropteroate synthase [Bartonella sp. TP]